MNYEELNSIIPLLPIFKSLQSKSDYGNHISEISYQLSAKTLAGRLARILDANDDKAEALTALAGCYFPIYGKEGKIENISLPQNIISKMMSSIDHLDSDPITNVCKYATLHQKRDF